MSILKSLFGKQDEPTTPTWDIKPRAERPAPSPRKQSCSEPPPVPEAKKEPNPFLDDPMLDTMTLEVDDLDLSEDNPYQTNTWEFDPDNDTRRLRTFQIGEDTEKKPGSNYNPYDTGKMRRGWKK